MGCPLLPAIDNAEHTARRRAWASDINRSRTHMQLTSSAEAAKSGTNMTVGTHPGTPRGADAIDQLAVNTIRTLSMDAVQAANSGHPGTPMALARVIYKLWQDYLRLTWSHRSTGAAGLHRLDRPAQAAPAIFAAASKASPPRRLTPCPHPRRTRLARPPGRSVRPHRRGHRRCDGGPTRSPRRPGRDPTSPSPSSRCARAWYPTTWCGARRPGTRPR